MDVFQWTMTSQVKAATLSSKSSCPDLLLNADHRLAEEWIRAAVISSGCYIPEFAPFESACMRPCAKVRIRRVERRYDVPQFQEDHFDLR